MYTFANFFQVFVKKSSQLIISLYKNVMHGGGFWLILMQDMHMDTDQSIC